MVELSGRFLSTVESYANLRDEYEFPINSFLAPKLSLSIDQLAIGSKQIGRIIRGQFARHRFDVSTGLCDICPNSHLLQSPTTIGIASSLTSN